jgi:hypothetical protein
LKIFFIIAMLQIILFKIIKRLTKPHLTYLQTPS